MVSEVEANETLTNNLANNEEAVARAREFLGGLLERMNIQAEIQVSEEEDKTVLDIGCDDAQRIIGRRGQVLDAMQHLVAKIASGDRAPKGDRRKPIVLDSDGYRSRCVERLESLADRMGSKALDTGTIVELNPMSAHDRRIVHMALANVEGLSTRSEGQGDRRHILVVPDGHE